MRSRNNIQKLIGDSLNELNVQNINAQSHASIDITRNHPNDIGQTTKGIHNTDWNVGQNLT